MTENDRVIRAKRIELEDDEGIVRATVAVQNGVPFVHLEDARGGYITLGFPEGHAVAILKSSDGSEKTIIP